MRLVDVDDSGVEIASEKRKGARGHLFSSELLCVVCCVFLGVGLCVGCWKMTMGQDATNSTQQWSRPFGWLDNMHDSIHTRLASCIYSS